jgi:hypothetical protein
MYAAAATGAREAAWHLQAQREIRRADVEEQQNKCTQPHVAPALVREEQHVKASNMFAANTEEEEEEEEDNNDSPMKAAYYQPQQENPDFPFLHDMCAFYAQEWLEECNYDVAKVSAMLREKQAAIDKLQLEFLNVSRKYLFEFLVDMGGSADEVAAMLREKLANPRFSQIVAATEWSDHGSDFDDRSEWSDSDGDDDDDHFHNDDKSEAFNALLAATDAQHLREYDTSAFKGEGHGSDE